MYASAVWAFASSSSDDRVLAVLHHGVASRAKHGRIVHVQLVRVCVFLVKCGSPAVNSVSVTQSISDILLHAKIVLSGMMRQPKQSPSFA